MTVGWYVHHHGSGHAQRLAAVRPKLDAEVCAFSSHPDVDGVRLPLDVGDEPPRDADAHGTLHWAPLGVRGLSDRMAVLAHWIATARPDAFVVDVSVEVALLARLLGVQTICVLQRGRRTDPAHALAYAQAAALVAPWTSASHAADDYPLAPERIDFTGAIARFDRSPVAGGDDVLLVVGDGGHGIRSEDVRAAAEATPDVHWHVAGSVRANGAGIVDHGPRADVESLIARCGVVVGSAGGNVVAEVAAARRPFVCLPQERPFAEQRSQAEALRRLGVAEVRETWPAPGEWPGVLARARRLDTARWSGLHDGSGADRFAAVVRRVAGA